MKVVAPVPGSTAPASRSCGILFNGWPGGQPAGHEYLEHARLAEAAGFDSVLAGDHIFPVNSLLDSLSLIAGYAAVTSRVQVGPMVLLAGLREPAVAAKQLASIDVLSGGRLMVGVGVGGEIPAEWAAMEIPLTERARRTDEALDVFKAIWSGEPVDFHGRFRNIAGVTGTPIPVRRPGPPVWIGGRSPVALRRAARHQGWCAYAMSPRSVQRSIVELNDIGVTDRFRYGSVVFCCVAPSYEKARSVAGDLLSQQYGQEFHGYLDAFGAIGTVDQVATRLSEFAEAGVTDVFLCPFVPHETVTEQLAALAEARAVSTFGAPALKVSVS